jgi:hypothetical protein
MPLDVIERTSAGRFDLTPDHVRLVEDVNADERVSRLLSFAPPADVLPVRDAVARRDRRGREAEQRARGRDRRGVEVRPRRGPRLIAA